LALFALAFSATDGGAMSAVRNQSTSKLLIFKMAARESFEPPQGHRREANRLVAGPAVLRKILTILYQFCTAEPGELEFSDFLTLCFL